jgi:hypothetical protein
VSLDRLERATHALRETTQSEASRSNTAALGRGLDRLAHLDRAKPPARLSMRHVRMVAWTLAASLLGVGAWANVTGRVNWFVPEPASAPPAELAAPPPPLVARERPHRRAAPLDDGVLPAEPEPASPAETPAPSAEPPALRAPVAPPVSPPASGGRERRPPAPHRAAPPSPPDADALYRAAHQAHFARADYAQALALWDAYLAEAEPGHRWKIEARYNRGIALYRLGQGGRAREALEPFARGEYGGYRRADARRLLETLPHSE